MTTVPVRSASGRSIRRVMTRLGGFALALATATAIVPTAAAAQSGPPGGMPQGGMPPGGMPPGGMPRPPRPPKPIKVSVLLEAVSDQFLAADRNRDGYLTLAEVREQIRDLSVQAVRRRFAEIDTNRNGTLEFEEFAQWQARMGAQVLSDTAAAGIRPEFVPETLPLDLGSGENAMILRMLIAPLGATVILAADADSDGRVTLAELQQYQRRKFDELDANKDGALDFTELPKPGPGPGGRGPGDGMPMPPPGGMPPPGRPG